MASFNKRLSISIFISIVVVWSLSAQAEPPPDWQRLLKADPVAQAEWALRYEHGEGVSQDYPRAIALYCAAAERGHTPAQYQLGWLYANGRGVARDDALAAAWFRLAAAKGDVYAQRMLAQVDDPGQRPRPATCPATAVARQHPDFKLAVNPIKRDNPDQQRIADWVAQLAPNYKLDPALVLALIAIESNFQTSARSPKKAQGLMQLIPATAARFGVQDPLDPLQNLHGGMAYLRWLLAFFEGDVKLALAGYNAGEQAVVKYGGIPPYAETQAYVEKITRLYGRATHPPVGLPLPTVSWQRPG